MKLSKIITSFVILCAGPLFAQSITGQTLPYVTTPYHPDNGYITVTPATLLLGVIAETIPENSVDPVYLDKTPSCPRSEYHIRWYIVKKQQYPYSGGITFTNTDASWIISSSSPSYVFQPVCIPN